MEAFFLARRVLVDSFPAGTMSPEEVAGSVTRP